MTDNDSQITDAARTDDSTQQVVRQTEFPTDATEPTYQHIKQAVRDKTVWYVLADLMSMFEIGRRERVERDRSSGALVTSRNGSRVLDMDRPLSSLTGAGPSIAVNAQALTPDDTTQDVHIPPVADDAPGQENETGVPHVWRFSPHIDTPPEAEHHEMQFSRAETEAYHSKARLLTEILSDHATMLASAGIPDTPGLVLMVSSCRAEDDQLKVALSTRAAPKVSVEAVFNMEDRAWEHTPLLGVTQLYSHRSTPQASAYARQEDLLRATRQAQATQATQTTPTTQAD